LENSAVEQCCVFARRAIHANFRPNARCEVAIVKRRTQWCLGLWCLLAETLACAQNCALPVPFQYEFQNNVTASLAAANSTDPCALSVSLNAPAGPTAAGFLHYRRPAPTSSVRYGFRIDTSALTNFTLPTHAVQLFSASSPIVSAGPPAVSNVLQIQLVGGSSNPDLRFDAACGVCASGLFVAHVPVTQTLNTIRFEIDVGSGTAGLVRYWLNHAFSDPPDGLVDNNGAGLDNATWIGVVSAELGLSSPSIGFRANRTGSTIVFDQIESSDDQLFWDDFSSGAQ
jgi:hypothetical protein